MKNLSKPDKKYTALLILVELLRHAQFITFNRIRRFDYIQIFKSIITEKEDDLRNVGLRFIDECIKETSKRTSKWKLKLQIMLILQFLHFQSWSALLNRK